MPNEMRQPFDPRGEYIARRSFKCAGHHFEPGDDFPWKRLSIDNRTLFRLFNSLYITHKSQGEDLKRVYDSESTKKSDKKSGTSETNVTDIVDSDEEGFIFDPEIHTLEHLDTNHWWILRGGDQVLRITRKEWKRLESKTKPTKVKMDRVVTEE